jgi:hypothetical protein
MLRVLNELLIGRMLAQILHTARISSRSDVLVAEPFLVVGLIASIRRILVLVTLAKAEAGTNDSAIAFRTLMMELGLLSLLVPVLGIFDYALAVLPSRRGRGEFPLTEQGAERRRGGGSYASCATRGIQ